MTTFANKISNIYSKHTYDTFLTKCQKIEKNFKERLISLYTFCLFDTCNNFYKKNKSRDMSSIFFNCILKLDIYDL